MRVLSPLQVLQPLESFSGWANLKSSCYFKGFIEGGIDGGGGTRSWAIEDSGSREEDKGGDLGIALFCLTRSEVLLVLNILGGGLLLL